MANREEHTCHPVLPCGSLLIPACLLREQDPNSVTMQYPAGRGSGPVPPRPRSNVALPSQSRSSQTHVSDEGTDLNGLRVLLLKQVGSQVDGQGSHFALRPSHTLIP